MQTIMTVAEVAEYLKISNGTVYRLLKLNKIPAFKVGSDWRFNRDQIDKWRLAGGKRKRTRIRAR